MTRNDPTSWATPTARRARGRAPGPAIVLMALSLALAPEAARAEGKTAQSRPVAVSTAPPVATRIKEANFAPPLASVTPAAPVPDGLGLPEGLMSLQRGDLLSPETARVIATMTPEQIDALTLLLLSLGGGPGAAAASPPEGVAAPSEAPWIGNWGEEQMLSDDPLAPTDADMARTNSILPPPWQLVEESDGALVLELPLDPFSRIVVQQGMVLSALGEVALIEKSDAAVVVRFTDDQAITAARHPAVLQAEQDARAAALAAALPPEMPAEIPAEMPPEMPAEMPEAPTEAAPEDVAADDPPAPEAETAIAAAPLPEVLAVAVSEAEAEAKAETQGALWVQVASFRSAATVARLAASLREAGFEAEGVAVSRGADPWHVVRLRTTEDTLEETLARLRDLGFGDAFALRDEVAQTVQTAQTAPPAQPSPSRRPPVAPARLDSAPADAPGPAPDTAWIQAASFRTPANADRAEALFRDKGFETRTLRSGSAAQPMLNLRVRPTGASVTEALATLRAMGFADAYVIRTTAEGPTP